MSGKNGAENCTEIALKKFYGRRHDIIFLSGRLKGLVDSTKLPCPQATVWKTPSYTIPYLAILLSHGI